MQYMGSDVRLDRLRLSDDEASSGVARWRLARIQ
jgi:hypothetical protein